MPCDRGLAERDQERIVVMVPDLTGPDEELAGMCTVVGRIDDCLRLIN